MRLTDLSRVCDSYEVEHGCEVVANNSVSDPVLVDVSRANMIRRRKLTVPVAIVNRTRRRLRFAAVLVKSMKVVFLFSSSSLIATRISWNS